jgi:hypothetical protein
MDDPIHDQWLADLHAAERPRYFSSRLLTAEDLQLEQDYWRRKIQLHNRFAIGRGVVWSSARCVMSTGRQDLPAHIGGSLRGTGQHRRR